MMSSLSLERTMDTRFSYSSMYASSMGGVVVGVECERVVLDVFKGDARVQGDADAVFVEVFEVLHWFSLSLGGL